MSDLPVPQNWLVSPDSAIEEKWRGIQIQERKSRIVRHQQDIEDLVNGKIKELEIKIEMLKKEINHLENKKIINVNNKEA